ncbi:AmmeMemoRadiSam system protein B [Pararhodospirillum photometricum]|uniref:MEMO1 family protein RSPPHO_02915 n=1 Tax=Pararhodospirillum photometricum DSM 122 TaxID=1150469 RepID=H6SPL6_PARPM|nr:AmmeMemoRadiSam system protein B [Pararhodospirillum photometricum]CCG09541.1 Putative uncharacterized protein [Pararhodospirillum photometricum DSM 122]
MLPLRPTAVAGIFYPDAPTALARAVDDLLAEAPGSDAPAPKALIAPHAGYVYSGPTAAAAYARLAPGRDTIERVVLLGPSHRVPFRGLALTEAQGYASPLGPVAIDHAWADRLRALPYAGTLEDAHLPEHALEVHLPFLHRMLTRFTLVPVVCGQVSVAQMAAALAELWGGPETLIVVSSDLSHYLPYDQARALDDATAQTIEALDAEALGPREACGHIPVAGLLALARAHGGRLERLDLRSSGDTAGSRERVVGYGAWALAPLSLSPQPRP